MKKSPQNENINKKDKIEDEGVKKGFFKKVWYSINKIEKYSELSAEGIGRAIKYLVILIMILSIISSAITVLKTRLEIKNIAEYINENSPELTYSNETLVVNSQETIVDDNTNFGKIIIDTNTDEEEKINQYINDVKEDENAIIILKDKLILKEVGLQGTTTYNYKELFGEMGITEFNKESLIEYLTGSNIMSVYANLFLVLLIYAFALYIINALFNIAVIGIVGYLAAIVLKMKIRYVAVFNMAVYAITFPTILQMIYILINGLFGYTLNYFDIMYIVVASIYMIASIFILKAEFNKKQGEVQKIVEVEKQVKEEIEEKQKEEKEREDKDKNKDTKKEDKKSEETVGGDEPEGSNA
ncbi:MAG: DUF1189 domain-containing protein [Clostridia bacterium]|nr:DUF1189 domain-containing protein [Clostridia bacterium]